MGDLAAPARQAVGPSVSIRTAADDLKNRAYGSTEEAAPFLKSGWLRDDGPLWRRPRRLVHNDHNAEEQPMKRHLLMSIAAVVLAAALCASCHPRHPPHTPQPVPEIPTP